MARKDQLTGRGPASGNHVSRSNNKAKRRFNVNLQKKRFYIPEEDRWITLRVSTKTLKTINKKGIWQCSERPASKASRFKQALHSAHLTCRRTHG